VAHWKIVQCNLFVIASNSGREVNQPKKKTRGPFDQFNINLTGTSFVLVRILIKCLKFSFLISLLVFGTIGDLKMYQNSINLSF
jgi:hypothetical protein